MAIVLFVAMVSEPLRHDMIWVLLDYYVARNKEKEEGGGEGGV